MTSINDDIKDKQMTDTALLFEPATLQDPGHDSYHENLLLKPRTLNPKPCTLNPKPPEP